MPTAAKKKDTFGVPVRNLRFEMQREPVMPTGYTTGATTVDDWAWTTWNNTVTFDNATSAATLNVYNVWVNKTTGTGAADDIGWEADGGVYRAKRGGNAWQVWNTDTTTTDLIINQTWENWNVDWVPTAAPVIHIPRFQETEEARRAREEREVRATAERTEKEKMRKVVNDRAEHLLMGLLNEQQRRDWISSGKFFLHVGDRRYRIMRGKNGHGNVDLVDQKDTVLERFCALPGGQLPEADQIAGQLLAIRFDEENFINKAAASMQKDGHTPLKEQVRKGELRLAA